VVDTFIGRSLMRPDEVTLAERLRDAGYRTGIFGKWHLGDNAPLRATDQGFQAALTLKGGGIGQPSDPPGGDHYQDPTLYRNGKAEKMKGYVTDLITDGAVDFVGAGGAPFFAWVAYNAPHTPLEPPAGSAEPYVAAGLPLPQAQIYAMVENIDTNVGRLLDRLKERGLDRDTIVIFLTDNGPQQARFNGGLRGLKGGVFEGGIRVPFYLRWPARFPRGGSVPGPAAHVDVVPTILEAAGLPPASGIDGRSLLAHLGGAPMSEREIFLQWHRGDAPELHRSFTVVGNRWKLARPQPKDRAMLFDLGQDPAETTDVSAQHPDILERMLRSYEEWFKDVGRGGYAPARIHVGDPSENPVVLTRQDWRGAKAGWGPDSVGHWEIRALRSLKVRATLRFPAVSRDGNAVLQVGSQSVSVFVNSGQTSAVLNLGLRSGDSRLEAQVRQGEKVGGPTHVELAFSE
jgi:arylsulfatase A-like enzyme